MTTAPITDADLAALDAVVAAMTPGPLRVAAWTGQEDCNDGRHLYINNPSDRANPDKHIASWMHTADAEAFAALKGSYAALRARLDAAEAEVERLNRSLCQEAVRIKKYHLDRITTLEAERDEMMRQRDEESRSAHEWRAKWQVNLAERDAARA